MRQQPHRQAKTNRNYGFNKYKQNSPKIPIKVKRKISNCDKMADAPITTVSVDALLNIIPNFDGLTENDIDGFLRQINAVSENAKIPKNIRVIVIKNKLTGKARELLKNTEDLNNETDFDIFTEKLRENFKIEKNFPEMQSIFMDLKQKPHQSIEEFIKIFNITAAKYLNQSGHASKVGAKDFLATIKLSRFLDAIRPDISFEVKKNAPSSFEEAATIAKNIEFAYKSLQTDEDTKLTENKLCADLLNLSKLQEEKINNLTAELNKLNVSHAPDKNNLENKRWCDICKTTSHITDKCWYNKKNEQPPREINFQTRQNFLPNHQQQFQNFNVPNYAYMPIQASNQIPIQYTNEYGHQAGPNNTQGQQQIIQNQNPQIHGNNGQRSYNTYSQNYQTSNRGQNNRRNTNNQRGGRNNRYQNRGRTFNLNPRITYPTEN